MDRLTEKAPGCFEYCLKDHKSVPGEFGTYDAFYDYSMAVKKLGQYEDTGLPPDICAEYRTFEDEAVGKGVTFKRIIELMNAEAEGHLVVLPCKVGDAVYVIFDSDTGKAIYETRVQGISVTIRGTAILNFGGYPVQYAWDSDVGKTVFLTPAEAEAALKTQSGEG